MILSFPEGSVQDLVGGEWWVKDENPSPKRGMVILAYVPHVDQVPTQIKVIGRADDPTCHDKAQVQFFPFNITAPQKKSVLPVAALPEYPGEIRLLYRAKKRPVLIVAESGPSVDHKLIAGKPSWQTAPTLLVAPYYGRDERTGKRSGYSDALVERVQKCEYPQFFWEKLPLPGSAESILRFDHTQPLGYDRKNFELTGYSLGKDAISLLDEWLNWLISGTVEEDGPLATVFEILRK